MWTTLNPLLTKLFNSRPTYNNMCCNKQHFGNINHHGTGLDKWQRIQTHYLVFFLEKIAKYHDLLI